MLELMLRAIDWKLVLRDQCWHCQAEGVGHGNFDLGLGRGTHANGDVTASRARNCRGHGWCGDWVETNWTSSLRTKLNQEIGLIIRLPVMIDGIQNVFSGFIGLLNAISRALGSIALNIGINFTFNSNIFAFEIGMIVNIFAVGVGMIVLLAIVRWSIPVRWCLNLALDIIVIPSPIMTRADIV
jgi:hypothetical protein